jgi:ferredoxin-like protein FixX
MMLALWRSPEDHVWIPDFETRSCNIEVALETPRCLKCQSHGYLLRKATNRKWNYPRKRNVL